MAYPQSRVPNFFTTSPISGKGGRSFGSAPRINPMEDFLAPRRPAHEFGIARPGSKFEAQDLGIARPGSKFEYVDAQRSGVMGAPQIGMQAPNYRPPSPGSIAGQMNNPYLQNRMAMQARQRAETATSAPPPMNYVPAGEITYAGTAPLRPGDEMIAPGQYRRATGGVTRFEQGAPTVDQVMADRQSYARKQNDFAESVMPGDAYRRSSEQESIQQQREDQKLTQAQGKYLDSSGKAAMDAGTGALRSGEAAKKMAENPFSQSQDYKDIMAERQKMMDEISRLRVQLDEYKKRPVQQTDTGNPALVQGAEVFNKLGGADPLAPPEQRAFAGQMSGMYPGSPTTRPSQMPMQSAPNNTGQGSVPTQQSPNNTGAGSLPAEGTTATNRVTGQKKIWRGGFWVDIK